MNQRKEQDVLDIIDVNIKVLETYSEKLHNVLKVENRNAAFNKIVLMSCLSAMEICKRINDKFYNLVKDININEQS